jgi:hypothetical protein
MQNGDAGALPNEDWGSWEQNRERKRVLGADATPAERLAWLEEALRLALAAGSLPRKPEVPR